VSVMCSEVNGLARRDVGMEGMHNLGMEMAFF